MVDYDDIINYTRDELLEEYCKLFERFQDLSESKEADSQKIYELKRALATAEATQAYLSQELEQFSDNNDVEKDLLKAQVDLVELKKKYEQLKNSFSTLQQDYNTLLEENTSLSRNLEEALNKQREQVPANNETKSCEDDLIRIQILENENMDLLQKIDSFEERSVRYTLTIAECEKNVEIMRDQIVCLEENLQSKRTDLEEKAQVLESTQEQLAEANAKIAMLTSAPDNDGRKGNSLFAEVDDQRQAMKQLLLAQKKSYLEMKKIFKESEQEIRRLKRENIAMHTELEACSSIFCNADKVYHEKLNERVRHLLNQNEDLERKLKWTQDRLKELASEKGVMWLDSMLSFCKKETEDLKLQLHSVRIQKASLEEQLRNSQQDMARWRFESLKSRCILLDREHLLTENKVSFKPIQAFEYKLSEKEQKEARPRIVSSRRSTSENIERGSLIPLKHTTEESEITSQTITKQETEREDENSKAIKTECVEEQSAIILNKVIKPIEDTSDKKHPPTHIGNDNMSSSAENKENESDNIEISPILGNFAKLKAELPSPMRPSQRHLRKSTCNISEAPAKSILSKQNDLLVRDSGKNVKFSEKEDIVHNLSCEPSSPNSSTEIIFTSTANTTNKKANSKAIIKHSNTTKSNIVVRRVVVSSKHD